MLTTIIIDKKTAYPVYKQISLQFIKNIKDGQFIKDQQLPPERELARTLKVSRGTIKKAYEQLVNSGYATAEQGSGTFVSYDEGKPFLLKDEATKDVDQLIDQLLKMGFDFKEINSLFKVRLLNIQNSLKKINIAAVDCNFETLDIIKNQLKYMENINFMGFLLKDVLKYSHPDEIFNEFDVIFTTTTHFNELKDFINRFEEKIVKAVMSTDRETTVKIASILEPSSVGIITKTVRFGKIIYNNLGYSGLTISSEYFITTQELNIQKLKEFISDKKILIVPPLTSLGLTKEMYEEILIFNQKGGEIITFNYIIERGSLIYIEEKVSNVLKNNKSLREELK